jgi:myosin-crossreactive antigen
VTPVTACEVCWETEFQCEENQDLHRSRVALSLHLPLAEGSVDPMPDTCLDREPMFYLIGGGIASLAAAAFLIRDGDIPGRNITILEESKTIGGSLDAAGTPKDGYVMRGGRMLESKYLCTFDLFPSIPTLDDSKSVTQEIFEQNEKLKTSSNPGSLAADTESPRRSLASAKNTS